MEGVYLTADSKLEHWEILCRYWITNFHNFCRKANFGDSPHVYLEDGNTHHLSVAASQAGYATMREIYGKRNDGNARLDLCLFKSDTSELVEAKWFEFNLAGNYSVKSVFAKLDDACREVIGFTNDISSLFDSSTRILRRTGILFVTPYADPASFVSKINDLIVQTKSSSDLSYDVMSFCFPEKMQTFKTYYGERIYPGVILLARSVSIERKT